MNAAEIEAHARKLAEGGIDRHTIVADAEVRLGRKLRSDEEQAVERAWAASEPARRRRLRRIEARRA